MLSFPKMVNRHTFLRPSGAMKGWYQKIIAADPIVRVFEKLDGENFRFGMDYKGIYIGQRNKSNYLLSKADICSSHQHGHKFSVELVNTLEKMYDYFTELRTFDAYNADDDCFFGELVGNSLQRRFKWNESGDYEVYWYDRAYDIPKHGLISACNTRVYLNWRVQDRLEGRMAPVLLYELKLSDALDIDVDSLVSEAAIESNCGTVEGLVIRFDYYNPIEGFSKEEQSWLSSLGIKHKSKSFLETKAVPKRKTGHKRDPSPFLAFVTDERVRHVVDKLVEDKGCSIGAFLDMRNVKNVIIATMDDIAEEENDSNPLEKEDRKDISKEIVRIFKQMVFNI